MKLRLRSSWFAAALILAGLVTMSGAGASYASATPPKTVDFSAPVLMPNFASINKQNKHFMKVPKAPHHIVVGEPARRIVIPAIGIDSPVVPTTFNGLDWQVADWAVGYMVGSANPGKCTTWVSLHDCTTALAAHDDIKGELFKRTVDLQNGDKVYIYTKHTLFTYTVNAKYTVSQFDSSALFSSTKSIAMVTCTPYWVDTSRLVVTAVLTHEQSRHRRHHNH